MTTEKQCKESHSEKKERSLSLRLKVKTELLRLRGTIILADLLELPKKDEYLFDKLIKIENVFKGLIGLRRVDDNILQKYRENTTRLKPILHKLLKLAEYTLSYTPTSYRINLRIILTILKDLSSLAITPTKILEYESQLNKLAKRESFSAIRQALTLESKKRKLKVVETFIKDLKKKQREINESNDDLKRKGFKAVEINPLRLIRNEKDVPALLSNSEIKGIILFYVVSEIHKFDARLINAKKGDESGYSTTNLWEKELRLWIAVLKETQHLEEQRHCLERIAKNLPGYLNKIEWGGDVKFPNF